MTSQSKRMLWRMLWKLYSRLPANAGAVVLKAYYAS
jgi:hypothetical protein